MANKSGIKDNVSFAVGTGRCGTHFLAQLFEKEVDIASSHERSPLSDSFHRYFKWYGIPVDSEGFLCNKEKLISKDLDLKKYSFESSAFLSLSLEELYKRFDAKIILMIRSPEKVVNSYIGKGWYEADYQRNDFTLPPSYQESAKFHHFLGRIVPSGDKYLQWCELSRIGKLAWYWNALNQSAIDQLSRIPSTHWRIIKLEELDYDKYIEICDFIGFRSALTKEKFHNKVHSNPGARKKQISLTDWTDHEISEFESEVSVMAEYFDYKYDVKEIKKNIKETRKDTILYSKNVIKNKIRKLFKSK